MNLRKHGGCVRVYNNRSPYLILHCVRSYSYSNKLPDQYLCFSSSGSFFFCCRLLYPRLNVLNINENWTERFTGHAVKVGRVHWNPAGPEDKSHVNGRCFLSCRRERETGHKQSTRRIYSTAFVPSSLVTAWSGSWWFNYSTSFFMFWELSLFKNIGHRRKW